MESGPRALGNRSIVVDPTRAEMKDILNARVKRREGFRPFAPSVLEERAEEFFLLPGWQKSPHMMLIAEITPSVRGRIPAVSHVDGTARVQTVSKQANPRYWSLIREFEKITGIPVLLNTSFNENEPIVCNPEQAIACFRRTDFDVLAIGDFLVTKENA
jgi:carbamoyltransferase